MRLEPAPVANGPPESPKQTLIPLGAKVHKVECMTIESPYLPAHCSFEITCKRASLWSGLKVGKESEIYWDSISLKCNHSAYEYLLVKFSVSDKWKKKTSFTVCCLSVSHILFRFCIWETKLRCKNWRNFILSTIKNLIVLFRHGILVFVWINKSKCLLSAVRP